MASEYNPSNCLGYKEKKEPAVGEANDMQTGCTSETLSNQQLDYFVFKAQRGESGTGKGTAVGAAVVQGQKSTREAPEEAHDGNSTGRDDTRGQGLAHDQKDVASASEDAQADWKHELSPSIRSFTTPLLQQSLPEPSDCNHAQPPGESSLGRMLLSSCLLAYLLPVQNLRQGSEEPTDDGQKELEPAGTSQAAATGQQEASGSAEERGAREVEAYGSTSEAHTGGNEAGGVGDEGNAVESQSEEQPQQLHQGPETDRLRELNRWLGLLDPTRGGGGVGCAHGAAGYIAQGLNEDRLELAQIEEDRRLSRRMLRQLDLKQRLLGLTKKCKAGLKRGTRLSDIMLDLVTICMIAGLKLSHRQRKRLYRPALAHRCLRRALRQCFVTRDDWLWGNAAHVIRLTLARDPTLLYKHRDFLWGIVDQFGIVGVMLRNNCNIQFKLVRALIDVVPIDGSRWMDPLVDTIVSQTVAFLGADVSAGSQSGFVNDSYALARACVLLTYCVREHGARLRPILFHHGALEAVAPLAGRPEQHVAEAAVAFLRACVKRPEPQYLVRLARGQLFAPAFAAFESAVASGRHTAATEAVHSLLDVLLEENLLAIVSSMCERSGHHRLLTCYASAVREVRSRYESDVEL